jgi:hypothetical protein
MRSRWPSLSIVLLACAQGADPGPPVDTDPPDTDVVDTDPPDTDVVDTDPPDTDVVDTDVEPPPDPGSVPPELSLATPPGVFEGRATLELVCSDPNAELWFTLDGSPPAPGAAQRWTGPIEVSRSTQLRAVAVNAHGDDAIAGTWVEMDGSLRNFSTNLPVIVLWSEVAAPVDKLPDYTPFTLSTLEPPPGGRLSFPADAVLSAPAGLKIRGSSTAYYPKRPYRIETWEPEENEDDSLPLLGMPAEADWVLGAPLDFDRALMRDPLMFALSNLIGRYAPRTRYAELFVVDEGRPVRREDYVGVYVLTERIERDADRVAITALLPTDLQLPEISGGYIFKEDRLGPGELGFYAGRGDGRLQFQQPFVLTDPDETEVMPDQQAWIAAQLDELGVALTTRGFTHPVTGRHYRDIIDVDAWIDHHILNVLAKNPDAFRLSGYFHKDRDQPIAAGPVWDFDRTLGCSSDFRAEDPTWWDATHITADTTDVFGHGFWRGLFSDPDFRAAWTARWVDLLNTTLTVPAIHAVIDGFEAEISEAAGRNFLAWPDYGPRGGSHAAEVQLLKDWVTERHAWIQGCLSLPDPRDCRGR